jgi:hypothetical protein
MKRGRKLSNQSKKSFEEFFNAFVSCPETNDALIKGILSTSTTKKSSLSSLKQPTTMKTKPPKNSEISSKITTAVDPPLKINQSPPPSTIPSPYLELLQLQLPDGRWPSLEDVLCCLNLPMGNYSFKGVGNLEIWEEATIFALASIRQRYDLFHCLGDAHDKAMTWMVNLNSSKILIKQATEILVQLSLSTNLPPPLPSSSEESRSRPNSPGRMMMTTTVTSQKRKKKINFDVPIDPYRKLLEQSSRHSFSRTYSAMLTMEQETSVSNPEELLAAQVEEERKKLASSLMNPSVNYSLFLREIRSTKEQFQSTEVSD